MDQTEKKLVEENVKIIYGNNSEEERIASVEEDLAKLKKNNEKLTLELVELKEEKKKVEHNLFDLFNASEMNKDKIKRIIAICEEKLNVV